MGSSCSSTSSTNTFEENALSNHLHNNNVKIKDDNHSVSSSSSDPSRPPTPFSRPLTGRVAQRPRTTTIFERESDHQRHLKSHSATTLLVDETMNNPGLFRTKSRGSMRLEPDGEAPVRRISRQLTDVDQEEISKLKEFLREKGL